MPVTRASSKPSSRRAKLSSHLSNRASTERPEARSSTSNDRTHLITKCTPSSDETSTKHSPEPSLPPSATEASSGWLSIARSLLLEMTDTEDLGFCLEAGNDLIRMMHLEKMDREPGYAYFFVRSLERHVRLWRAKPLLIQGAFLSSSAGQSSGS